VIVVKKQIMALEMKTLDNTTLEGLAELICGDGEPYYRKGWELPIFFRNAGLDCPNHDGSTRKWWTLARLKEYNIFNPVDIEKVVKRITDPKEHKGDSEMTNKVLNRLNEILSVEGLKVEIVGVSPIIREITPALVKKKKETSLVFPIPNFSIIVDDSSLDEILKSRWKETVKCIESEAYLSGIIMMGSILEGILLSVIHQHPLKANQAKSSPKDKQGKVKKFEEWTLSDMIDVAHELEYIKGDVRQFSHALRDYRNMVHPWYQRAKGDSPDEDSCKICWQVVCAAVNDLICFAEKSKTEGK
jgi:hypothetical protein